MAAHHSTSNPPLGHSPENYERRFGHIETNVGILQSDVSTLREGQSALQLTQTAGFNEIKTIINAKQNEDPKISFKMLLTAVGVLVTAGAIGVGAFWAVVLLLAQPMQAEIDEHKDETRPYKSQLALLEERVNQNANTVESAEIHSQERHEISKKNAEDIKVRLEDLRKLEIEFAAAEARNNEYHRWNLQERQERQEQED